MPGVSQRGVVPLSFGVCFETAAMSERCICVRTLLNNAHTAAQSGGKVERGRTECETVLFEMHTPDA
jgi:hypothetical protein